MAFVPWISLSPSIPAGFANLEQKSMTFRAKMIPSNSPASIVVHLAHGIYIQDNTAVLADSTQPGLWLDKNKKFFEPLLVPLQGSGYECLVLCGTWCGNPEGLALSHIQMGHTELILDPDVSSQMLQSTPKGLLICPWISDDITLGGSGFVWSPELLIELLARDSRWLRFAATGGTVSLQPTGAMVNGVISPETFAAYAVEVNIPASNVSSSLSTPLPSMPETKVEHADAQRNGQGSDTKTACSSASAPMTNGEQEQSEDEEDKDFSQEQITQILAQYLTPEVLEQIPVHKADEASIYFVQYVCDFVKADLWEQRQDMNESRWIGIVRRLKSELYAYLDRKAATV